MSSQIGSRFSTIPARAVDDVRFDKSPKTLLVLCAVGTYSDREGWCWYNALEVRFGWSHPVAQKHLGLLVKWGYLEKRSPNKCRILFDQEGGYWPFMRPYSEIADVIVKNQTEQSPEEPTKPREIPTEKIPTLAMAKILANVCNLDAVMNRGMLMKNASDLIKAGYSLLDITRLYAHDTGVWYGLDFRGKKGELPTIPAIRFTIANLMQATDVSEEVTGDVQHGWFNG